MAKPNPLDSLPIVAAAKAGAEPARSVVFEDAPVGIQAAKAAGMFAVGLATTHPAPALQAAGADEVIPAGWLGSQPASPQPGDLGVSPAGRRPQLPEAFISQGGSRATPT